MDVLVRIPVTGYIEAVVYRDQRDVFTPLSDDEFEEVLSAGEFIIESSDPLGVTLQKTE